MIANLNKLVNQYNNIYHSIGKKFVDFNYFSLTEELYWTSYKAPKFKVGGRVRIAKYNNTFSKGYTENSSREIF